MRAGRSAQATQNAPQALSGGRGGVLPPRTAVGALGSPGGRQTLILDGFPSVLQVKLLGPNTSTANRYGLSRVRQAVKGSVAIEVRRQRIHKMPPPVRVTLRYVFSDARARDADNFAIVGKPVVDGLVKAGILAGDDAKRLRETIEFVKERGARRLEVILEPDR